MVKKIGDSNVSLRTGHSFISLKVETSTFSVHEEEVACLSPLIGVKSN